MLKAYRRVYELLPLANRREALRMLPFMILNGLLEVAGVGGVLPFVAAVTDPEAVEHNRFLKGLYRFFQPETHEQFLLVLFLGGSFLFASVNALGALTYWLSNRFANNARHAISTRLLECYLSRPFAWHLGQNSNKLSKDILSEVDLVTSEVLMKLAENANRIFCSSFIFAALLYIDFTVAISTVCVLGLVYRMILLFFKTKIAQLGEERMEANSGRFRAVTEAFSTVKEGRLFGRRAYLKERFVEPSQRLCDRKVLHKVVSRIPKYLVETLAIVTILGLTVLLIIKQHPTALPLVALYIMAVWRLVPSIQDIYKNLTAVRFYEPTLSVIYEQMMVPVEPGWEIRESFSPVSFQKSIDLEKVSFGYSGSSEQVLSDIDLQIEKNTTVALVGRTGSGKSTLADILAGHLEPSSGTLRVDGQSFSPKELADWREMVRMVPQDVFLLDESVKRNIAIGLKDQDIDLERMIRVAKLAQIHDFVSTQLERGYDTTLGERGVNLSGGQKQRVGIARALYDEPELLILDESTSALDKLTEEAVLTAIREFRGQRTVVLITHRLATVKECDQICLLQDGRLRAVGTFEELELREPLFRELVKLEQGRVEGTS